MLRNLRLTFVYKKGNHYVVVLQTSTRPRFTPTHFLNVNLPPHMSLPSVLSISTPPYMNKYEHALPHKSSMHSRTRFDYYRGGVKHPQLQGKPKINAVLGKKERKNVSISPMEFTPSKSDDDTVRSTESTREDDREAAPTTAPPCREE